MTSIDDKIKQALDKEFNEITDENENYDSGILNRYDPSFKGKLKKYYKVAHIFILTSQILFIISVIMFVSSDNVKLLIGFAASSLFFATLAMFGESWYASELGRNRVIREIKLLELQLAQVIKIQEK